MVADWIARVFPTPVGVFLGRRDMREDVIGLPHARGGVSKSLAGASWLTESSPRPWGCFRMIVDHRTRIGGLPHARGGVSFSPWPRWRQGKSSPRPWGCFPRAVGALRRATVFPTPVGVFLLAFDIVGREDRLPHARGGVSRPDNENLRTVSSSPRPWGCFSHCAKSTLTRQVFPTPVGVFPSHLPQVVPVPGLPHARGGVSG